MQAFHWQLRRALFYLWADRTLIGFQAFARVVAVGIGLLLVFWTVGWLRPSSWLVCVIFASGIATMVFQLARQAPKVKDAADLIDKWSGKADLARSFLDIAPDHPAKALLAHQTAAVAEALPARLVWPRVPVQALMLPCVIVAAGVIVLQVSDEPTVRAALSDAQAKHAETSQISESAPETARAATQQNDADSEVPSSAGQPDAEPQTLAEVLAQSVGSAALELDAEAGNGKGSAAATGPSDGDGAGTAFAAAQTPAAHISPLKAGTNALQLSASASDNGRDLLLDPATVAGSSLNHLTNLIALPAPRETTGALLAMSPEDRALSRRYFDELNGVN